MVAAEINPTGFYDDLAVVRLLGIAARDQKKGRDRGELKFTKKGPQILYRGQWLLDWLEPSGEPSNAR